jgi:hypothetical protein
MKSNIRKITPSYLGRKLLTETFKNLLHSVNIVRSRYLQNFLGKRIGKSHLGELDLDGNTLLISVFGNRLLKWREPNSNCVGLVKTKSRLW